MTAAPTAATTVAGVIGDPIRHSRSPAIHNAAFAASGLDWVFAAFEVAAGAGAGAVDAMRSLGIGGLSVTMPLKAEVLAAVDEVSDTVASLGAANCLVPLGSGRVRAENTDGVGFVRGFEADTGSDVAGRRFAVLGTGGAARAVTAALGVAGAAEVVVVGRSSAAVDETAGLARVARAGSIDDLSRADVVVNATPVGMSRCPGFPCPPELLGEGQVGIDLVYDPIVTDWQQELGGRGVAVHGGLSMLVHQAAVAFEHWTRQGAPLEVMRAAAQATSAVTP